MCGIWHQHQLHPNVLTEGLNHSVVLTKTGETNPFDTSLTKTWFTVMTHERDGVTHKDTQCFTFTTQWCYEGETLTEAAHVCVWVCVWLKSCCCWQLNLNYWFSPSLLRSDVSVRSWWCRQGELSAGGNRAQPEGGDVSKGKNPPSVDPPPFLAGRRRIELGK